MIVENIHNEPLELSKDVTLLSGLNTIPDSQWDVVKNGLKGDYRARYIKIIPTPIKPLKITGKKKSVNKEME